MKFIDLVKLATRMFRARTSRTLLTIIGIGVGMATILFLVSLGFGVQRVVLSRITTIDSLSSIDVYPLIGEEKEFNWETVEKIGYIKEIDKTVPLLEYEGRAKIGDFSSNASLSITEAGYTNMDGKILLKGEGLSSEKPEGIVLSSSFLKVLGGDLIDLIGREVEIVLNIPNEEEGQFTEKKVATKFKVIGIVKNDKSNIYINLNNFKKEEFKYISSIKVRAKDFKQVDEAKRKIEILGYQASSVSELVDQSKRFFSMANFALAVLGIVALAVSSIGMFNTMVITLLERTEEIGIMKSIGATDRNILSIFIFESALMGFLGGVFGVIMGFLAQIFFNFIINLIAVRMGGEAFKLFYSPLWFMLLLIIVSFMIGVITGLIPARKASIIDPLEALKRR